jgi:hypothetical protein
VDRVTSEPGLRPGRTSAEGKHSLSERRWLTLARALWLGVALTTLVVYLVSLPRRYDQLVNLSDRWLAHSQSADAGMSQLGISASFYARYDIALDGLILAGYFATGVLLFWRRSADWMALLLSICLITYTSYCVHAFEGAAVTATYWGDLRNVLVALGLFSSLTALYLFPTGRFVPRWSRWLALTWGVWILAGLVVPTIWFSPSLQGFPFSVASQTAYLLWYLSGTLAQVYRFFRTRDAVRRQQTKWIVFGLVVAVTGYYLYILPPMLLPAMDASARWSALFLLLMKPVYVATLLLIPLSIGFSILRYRLWDIDVLINRALVYGALSTMLGGIYVGSILLLQMALGPFIRGSNLAVAISTLAVAAMFRPALRRVQRLIDLRFYRRRYDSQLTLDGFTSRLRDEIDLDALRADIVTVVNDTMQPATVFIWLRQDGSARKP